MSADTALISYYAKRAAEYERIYLKPERQDDLRRFTGGLAAFWWSHVPRAEVRGFLGGFHQIFWILSYVAV